MGVCVYVYVLKITFVFRKYPRRIDLKIYFVGPHTKNRKSEGKRERSKKK